MWFSISTLEVFRGFGQHHLVFSVSTQECTGSHVAGAALTALEGFPLHTLFTSVFRPSQARGEEQHAYELMRHWKARSPRPASLRRWRNSIVRIVWYGFQYGTAPRSSGFLLTSGRYFSMSCLSVRGNGEIPKETEGALGRAFGKGQHHYGHFDFDMNFGMDGAREQQVSLTSGTDFSVFCLLIRDTRCLKGRSLGKGAQTGEFRVCLSFS